MAPLATRQSGGRHLWRNAPPRIEIRNLTFAYESGEVNKVVLQDVSLTANAGGFALGVVGMSRMKEIIDLLSVLLFSCFILFSLSHHGPKYAQVPVVAERVRF